jgi:hypothetical protein
VDGDVDFAEGSTPTDLPADQAYFVMDEEELLAECLKLREALEAALHDLGTTHGMWVTESYDEQDDARLDFTKTIDRIREAMGN